jgi:hypothetical protein
VADTTYATTDDLREILDIPESDGKPTALLQRYLNAAAEVIDAQTRGSLEGYEAFSASASETRYFDDIISNNGAIDIDDAVTVTALTRGGVTIASTDYYTYPYNRGNGPITQLRLLSSALVSNPVYQMLGRSYNFPYKGVGVKAMAVTGTWGYCTAGTEATRNQGSHAASGGFDVPQDLHAIERGGAGHQRPVQVPDRRCADANRKVHNERCRILLASKYPLFRSSRRRA